MANKIFVSYKYADSSVRSLDSDFASTARDYVDLLEGHLGENNYIYKGEKDGEDLSAFTNETIASKLRDKIHDSSVTIVLVSKSMIDNKSEEEQWIPWEVSYSLREQTRGGRTSGTNAIIAIAIPDENDSYDHFIMHNTCQSCNCDSLQTHKFFGIISKNMFNKKVPNQSDCGNHFSGNKPHIGNDHSYIYPVKWDDFITDINSNISIATEIRENIIGYNIKKAL